MIISAHHNGCHSKRPNPSLQRLICSTMIPGLLHQLISSKILQQHLGGKLPLNNHIPEHLPFQLKTPFPDMRSLWRGQARLEVIWVFHLAHRRLLLAPQKKKAREPPISCSNPQVHSSGDFSCQEIFDFPAKSSPRRDSGTDEFTIHPILKMTFKSPSV